MMYHIILARNVQQYYLVSQWWLQYFAVISLHVGQLASKPSEQLLQQQQQQPTGFVNHLNNMQYSSELDARDALTRYTIGLQ